MLYASTVPGHADLLLLQYICTTRKQKWQKKTAKTPLMDFTNECRINSATGDTLLIHVKLSQTVNVFPLRIAGYTQGMGSDVEGFTYIKQYVASIILNFHLALSGVFPRDNNTWFTVATTVSALLL